MEILIIIAAVLFIANQLGFNTQVKGVDLTSIRNRVASAIAAEQQSNDNNQRYSR